MVETLRKNRSRLIIIAGLLFLLFSATQGMTTEDWVITLLRGLSVGAITFLVASGLSLIFGLMDVLNLAHGELFMLGAYIGWTVFVRPDTFVDLITPLALLAVGFVLTPLWRMLLSRMALGSTPAQIGLWLAGAIGLAVLFLTLTRYPVTRWNPEQFAESPGTYALALSQGNYQLPAALPFEQIGALTAVLGILLGSVLLAAAVAGMALRRQASLVTVKRPTGALIAAAVLLVLALGTLAANDALTAALVNMGTTPLFFIAMFVATGSGFVLGWLIESTLIRPLYDRPIYQIMLTLGIGFILIEVVRAIWGRPEFTMPKAALFNGTGDGCPATSVGDLLANQCSTILLFDSRLRTYNEVFIIIVGVIVLVAVYLLLQRTRIGMIIRAGVQDSEMVEALGINVRQVFTFVFALGVGLAALGGVLAAPSIGLSNAMGANFLLFALIALAIGGLTSYPGAAAGAVLVGLVQQFMIKYGQIGINLPFMAEPFKPTPPLVPASTVLLMIIILLFLPNGLFGRSE